MRGPVPAAHEDPRRRSGYSFPRSSRRTSGSSPARRGNWRRNRSWRSGGAAKGAARSCRGCFELPGPWSGLVDDLRAAGRLRVPRLDLATLNRRAHVPIQRRDRPRILHYFPEEAFAIESPDVGIIDDRRQWPSSAMLRNDVAAQVGLAERPPAEKQIRIAREPTPLWPTGTRRSRVGSEPYPSSLMPRPTKHRDTIIPAARPEGRQYPCRGSWSVRVGRIGGMVAWTGCARHFRPPVS